MSKEIKITLYFAVGAFFISLVFGLVSGNPFGIVLYRAIISSIILGAIVFGGLFLLLKYIPELEDAVGKHIEAIDKPKEKEEMKSTIDYTISGEGKDILTDNIEEVSKKVATDSNTFEGKAKKEESEFYNEAPDKEEFKNSDELPSLDDLYEEEDVVPDMEIDKEEIVKSEEATLKEKYIDVGGKRIPNEPELIAKAIKKVMKENE